jgi:hypothetical protein
MGKRRPKKGRKPTRSRSTKLDVEERARRRALVYARERAAKLAELKAAAAEHLDTRDLMLTREDGTEAIAFLRGREPVAYLFDDEIVTRRGGRRIAGNFLQPGPQWVQLRGFLLELQSGRDAPPERPLALTRARFPESLPDQLRTAAMQASGRIRTCRDRAFRHSVVLDAGTYEVRFDPIRSCSGVLEVPFSFRRNGSDHVEAALRVLTSVDPLEIAFGEDDDEDEVVRAWVVGLLGFADLSCAEATGVAAQAREQTPRGRAPRSRLSESSGSNPCQSLPNRRGARLGGTRLSPVLTPVGETAQYSGVHVAGHRRRLRNGRSCSDIARASARAFGIELGVSETWVKPHPRGLPENVMLEYAWQVPPQIARWSARWRGLTTTTRS